MSSRDALQQEVSQAVRDATAPAPEAVGEGEGAAARIARLEAEHRRKDEFLATLAHELRNALAPIRSAVRLLERSRLEDDTACQARGVLERQSAQLARMVEDLLDVSRMSTGKLALRRALLDARAVVEAAVETARPLLLARQQRLELLLPAAGALALEGDLERLSQALANLLCNAAKYTPPYGHITVALRAEDAAFLSIAVSDDGVGLEAEQLRRVFDLYMQADGAARRSAGGLGVGLALVRNIVELHGGQVSAHSDGPGRGARFTMRLPRAQAAADHGAPQPAAPARPTGPDGAAAPVSAAPSSRVLLVDDNPDAGQTLALLLQLDGHEVTRCLRGTEALERARAECFDVVLLDIGLPDLNGLEVGRALREEGASRGALLIAVSGRGQPEDRLATAAAGFDAHLVKPVDADELQALFTALHRRRGVEACLAERLGDARLRRFLQQWRHARGAARWAPLQPLLQATAALEPQRVVAAISSRHPFAMQFVAVGAALDELLPQSLLGRRITDVDVDSGSQEAAYRLVALSGEPGHESVEMDFGAGDGGLRFERLIVPVTAEPGSALPTHLVAVVCLDLPPPAASPTPRAGAATP